MFPKENESMLGIYARPSQLESTVMDEIVYTNDFREACSWIIDQIAELYVNIKPLMPYYIRKDTNDKPPMTISKALNPYRNNDDRARTSSERMLYHAKITARYIDGQVPTEDGGKMIRAVTAFFAILRGLHDCPELERLDDLFGAYCCVWNHVSRSHTPPDRFAQRLDEAAMRVIDGMEKLHEAWRTWENNVWPHETQFKFSDTDTTVLEERLARIGENMLKSQKKLGRDFAHRGSETLTIIGPRSEDKNRQVYEVVVYLANPKHSRSLNNACAVAFEKLKNLKNGYDTVNALWKWCSRNEARINEWVAIYRMEHAIEA